AKLPSGDEVGLIALDSNSSTPHRIWLTGFTSDRAQLKAALLTVPDLIQSSEQRESASSRQNQHSNDESQGRTSISVGSSSSNQSNAQAASTKEGERVTTLPSKKGVKVIRTERPDGAVRLERIS